MLLLLILMKCVDKHLNGSEQGSSFLSLQAHMVLVYSVVSTVDVLILKKAFVYLTPNSYLFALQSVVHIMQSAMKTQMKHI